MGRVSSALWGAVGLLLVPGQAWAQSSPYLYVPNESDNTVSVIDTGTNTTVGGAIPISPAGITPDTDLPPLKWSSLKYYFRMEDEIDGKEEAYG